jgi:hypothetical protein
MDSLPDLFNDLSQAMNQALWRSKKVLDAAAALEQAVGNFRISIDVLLPPAASGPGGSEPQFLRSSSQGPDMKPCRGARRFGAASRASLDRKPLIQHSQSAMR